MFILIPRKNVKSIDNPRHAPTTHSATCTHDIHYVYFQHPGGDYQILNSLNQGWWWPRAQQWTQQRQSWSTKVWRRVVFSLYHHLVQFFTTPSNTYWPSPRAYVCRFIVDIFTIHLCDFLPCSRTHFCRPSCIFLPFLFCAYLYHHLVPYFATLSYIYLPRPRAYFCRFLVDIFTIYLCDFLPCSHTYFCRPSCIFLPFLFCAYLYRHLVPSFSTLSYIYLPRPRAYFCRFLRRNVSTT